LRAVAAICSYFSRPARVPSRPLACGFAYAFSAGPVDGGLHDGEDRPLDGRGEQDFAPAAVFVGGVRRVIVVTHNFPHLLESQSGEIAGRPRRAAAPTGL
jgi:hypothetical protein